MKSVNVTIFNMITKIIEAKSLMKYISCDCNCLTLKSMKLLCNRIRYIINQKKCIAHAFSQKPKVIPVIFYL